MLSGRGTTTLIFVILLVSVIFIVNFSMMLAVDFLSPMSPLIRWTIHSILFISLLFPLSFIVFRQPMEKTLNEVSGFYAEQENISIYDLLTGLPNRRLVKDRLVYSIEIARRDKHQIALILLDINRLRDVNDTLGHKGGDLIIKELASRLLSHFRKSDSISRIGSDEFLILLPKTAIQHALDMGSKLNHLLEEPFFVQNIPVNIEVTMGVAVYPDHGVAADTLMQRADVALRNAKNRKEEISIYTKTNDLHSRGKLALAGELRNALNNEEFYLEYQPKVDINSGVVCGVEALVRWDNAERGVVGPDKFIPTIEKIALVKPFTEMTLVTAMSQCKQWQTSRAPIKVAVNLSARLLLDETLPAHVFNLLDQWGLAPDMLELEITESAIMTNPDLAKDILEELHNRGVMLSIDDFGTGYTSLAYLSQLPVDFLKIDLCFISDLTSNKYNEAITKSIIELSHNLGLKVIAEGVEDEETLDKLLELGCDIAQGYYFSKPLSGKKIFEWISDHNKLPVNYGVV